jgi:hypothetical protein
LQPGRASSRRFPHGKDLKPAPKSTGSAKEEIPLGQWVANCYTIMMWSFLFGFVLLVIALLINVSRPQHEGNPQKIELAVPPNIRVQIFALPAEAKPPQNASPQPPGLHAAAPAPQRTTS